MEAPDYFQVDEPPTDTPLFDRLRDDTAPLARLKYNLSTIRPLDDDAKERLARKYYNEQLVPDERRAAAQHAAILSQVARDDGAGSDAMAAQLGALNTTLREVDDTEFSRKLRDLYSMFKKGYDDESGQTLRTVADNAFIAETQMRAPIAVPPLEGDQSGRGELTPSVVAQTAMNLNDNPLAAQLHARRLLSTSQAADATQMSHLQYTLERQQQLGPGRVRRRRGPVRTDWSKKKPRRV